MQLIVNNMCVCVCEGLSLEGGGGKQRHAQWSRVGLLYDANRVWWVWLLCLFRSGIKEGENLFDNVWRRNFGYSLFNWWRTVWFWLSDFGTEIVLGSVR